MPFASPPGLSERAEVYNDFRDFGQERRPTAERETASPAACRLAPEIFGGGEGDRTPSLLYITGMEARGVEPLTARCERAVLPTIPRPQMKSSAQRQPLV